MSNELKMPPAIPYGLKSDPGKGDQSRVRTHEQPESRGMYRTGTSEGVSRLLYEARADGEGLQQVARVGEYKRTMAVTDPEVVRLLLSGQEEIRKEIGSLARSTAAQGAKIDGMESRFEEIQSSMLRISQHTADCQARGGWISLREDVSEIRVMVSEHDRKLSENAGYQAGKSAMKSTPKSGYSGVHSMAPMTLSVAVKDPKTWAKIVFYTVLGAVTAASFIHSFL